MSVLADNLLLLCWEAEQLFLPRPFQRTLDNENQTVGIRRSRIRLDIPIRRAAVSQRHKAVPQCLDQWPDLFMPLLLLLKFLVRHFLRACRLTFACRFFCSLITRLMMAAWSCSE